MLFNSYVFLLAFLPIVMLAYALVHRLTESAMAARAVLAIASAIFIAWGGLSNLALLVVSLLVNYGFLRHLSRSESARARKTTLIVAVVFNLCFIGMFKYADFLIANIADLSGAAIQRWELPLPLAISFYTFQMIALVVDTWRKRWECPPLLSYSVFVMFFPQLIAGPIVRYNEIKDDLGTLSGLRANNIAAGLALIGVGLFKKACIADNLGIYANGFFTLVHKGSAPGLLEAWAGTLAYTFQIYFDFSGYSDMAIGFAWVFGIRLPANFLSPYKAASIIEFWRRWHMTLSRFLRDYLYIPLGGNRRGPGRRWVNVGLTMLIGGLWHGASWNFVFWGGLHGTLLAINHVAHNVGIRLPRGLGWVLTMTAVTLGWVIFRTTETDAAFRIYAGLIGLNGIVIPESLSPYLGWLVQIIPAVSFGSSELIRVPVIVWIALAAFIAFALPNNEEVFRGERSFLLQERFSFTKAVLLGSAALFGMINLYQAKAFVYFRF